jgi:hypothetical protein
VGLVPLSTASVDTGHKRIELAAKVGRFLGYVGDEHIMQSRQPFPDGAREPLARVYDPATPCNMRHGNSDFNQGGAE